MECRDCGTENPGDASVCMKCGATLPNTVRPVLAKPLSDNRIPIAIMGLMVGVLGVILMMFFAARDVGTITGADLVIPVFVWIVGIVLTGYAVFKD